MNLLWLLPPVVLIIGLAVVALILRAVDDAGAQVVRQLHALGEVREAVATVRTGTADARASLEELRRR